PDLQFECAEAVRERAPRVVPDTLVVISKPSDGSIVPRISGPENRFPGVPRWAVLAQDAERVGPGKRVFQITKIEEAHNLSRLEIQQQPPEGNAATFRPKIEAGICQGREREMNGSFVRSEPAQLRV